MSETTTVAILKTLHAKLKDVARADDRKVSYLVEKAIRRFLEEHRPLEETHKHNRSAA